MEYENRWNISRDQGELYIIEVFNEILNNYGTEIRADILSSKMNQLAHQKCFLLYYNGKKRNLNYYMRNNFIKLTNFMELHRDKYIVSKKKGILFVKKNEHWLDGEEWTFIE